MQSALGFSAKQFLLNNNLQIGVVGGSNANDNSSNAIEGLLHGILVNNDSTSQLINIRDGIGGGPVVAQHRTQPGATYFVVLDVQLQNGLYISTSGGTTPNVWYIYK